MEGRIKLHRKIDQWSWRSKPNTFSLFLYLLTNANLEPKIYRGHNIKRGDCVIGRKSLAMKIGVSEQAIRTALKHLKSTNEITIKSTNEFSIITLLKFDLYQCKDEYVTNESTSKSTNEQPTNNQRTTTPKEGKKENNKEYIISKDIEDKSSETKKYGRDDINILIESLKNECDILGISYDNEKDRNFGKHICGAKGYGEFCEKIGQNRIEFALNILRASVKIDYWKGPCAGPKMIYQNYSDVYNKTKQMGDKNKTITTDDGIVIKGNIAIIPGIN